MRVFCILLHTCLAGKRECDTKLNQAASSNQITWILWRFRATEGKLFILILLLPLCRAMDSLHEIGLKYGSDKFTVHSFAAVYEKHLSARRHEELNILEIGIGDESNAGGGASLRTWYEYFPSATIHAIDIYDKSHLDNDRILTHVCDQGDQASLHKLASKYGPFDLIIDDGSHYASDVLRSMFILLHRLSPGGVYIVEDVQTSYWPHYGGTSVIGPLKQTALTWLKLLVDVVNVEEILWPGHPAIRCGFRVESVHFYHNIAVAHAHAGVCQPSAVLNDKLKKEWLKNDLSFHGVDERIATVVNSPSVLQDFSRAFIEALGTLQGGE